MSVILDYYFMPPLLDKIYHFFHHHSLPSVIIPPEINTEISLYIITYLSCNNDIAGSELILKTTTNLITENVYSTIYIALSLTVCYYDSM